MYPAFTPCFHAFLPCLFFPHVTPQLPTANQKTKQRYTKPRPIHLICFSSLPKGRQATPPSPPKPKALGLEIEAWRCRVINSSLLTGEKSYRLPHSFCLVFARLRHETLSTRQPPYMPRYIPIHPSGCFEAARYHRQHAKLHPGFHAPNAYIPLKRHSSTPVHNNALVPPPQDSSFTSSALFYRQPLTETPKEGKSVNLVFTSQCTAPSLAAPSHHFRGGQPNPHLFV